MFFMQFWMEVIFHNLSETVHRKLIVFQPKKDRPDKFFFTDASSFIDLDRKLLLDMESNTHQNQNQNQNEALSSSLSPSVNLFLSP